jgi:WD40 repeat protein
VYTYSINRDAVGEDRPYNILWKLPCKDLTAGNSALEVRNISFDEDGDNLVILYGGKEGNSVLRLINIATRKELDINDEESKKILMQTFNTLPRQLNNLALFPPSYNTEEDRLTSFNLNPHDKQVGIYGDSSGRVFINVFPAAQPPIRRFFYHGHTVGNTVVRWTSNGRHAISINSSDRCVHIWNFIKKEKEAVLNDDQARIQEILDELHEVKLEFY